MVPPISLACAQCGNLPDCKSENRRSLQGVSVWSKREKDPLKEQSVSAPRGRIQECVCGGGGVDFYYKTFNTLLFLEIYVRVTLVNIKLNFKTIFLRERSAPH